MVAPDYGQLVCQVIGRLAGGIYISLQCVFSSFWRVIERCVCHREFDDSLTGDEEDLPVLVAFHVEDKDGFSHHGANRGSASIDLTAAPSDNLAIKTPCVASDLEV